VERCLACEADSVGAVDRCLFARLGKNVRRVPTGGYASASQARQRSTGRLLSFSPCLVIASRLLQVG
jgi:hypothetical protein